MSLGMASLGALAVGLCIICWALTVWWNTARWRWLALLPFFLYLVYGTLLISAAGGLLGYGADWTLWGSSRAGDAALEYGVGGRTADVTTADPVVLTDGGHVVLLILTTIVVTAMVVRRKGLAWLRAAGGIVAGICLGLTTGWVGWVLAWAGTAVNAVGAPLTGGH